MTNGFIARLILLAALFLLTAGPAAAQSRIIVNAGCSLADAITAANTDSATNGCPAGSGADTIVLTGKVELSANLPSITGTLTVDGRGRTIDGMDLYRIFAVEAESAHLTVHDITLTQAKAVGSSWGSAVRLHLPSSATGRSSVTLNRVRISDSAAGTGGGASCVRGDLSISDSVIANNSATGNGGGIGISDKCALTISRSAIHGNTAHNFGGGIYMDHAANSVDISNSTFYSNTATTAEGGGISLNGDVHNAPIKLRHLTITGNHVAGGRYKAAGIMVRVTNSAVNLRNSIIWGNTGAEQCGTTLTGGVTVYTNNIVQAHDDDNCGTASTADPRLPANPTGSIPYFALPDGSPAINAAPDCSALTTEDQRGMSRPYPAGGRCDLGAYEWHPAPPSGGGGESSSDEKASEDEKADSDDKTSSCETLSANIEVEARTESTECQLVSGAGIGHPDVAAAEPASVVDVWGWVKPDTKVCFGSSSGSIQYIDTAAMERTVTTLSSFSSGGMTCAMIPGAGQVALIADGSAPASEPGQDTSAPGQGPPAPAKEPEPAPACTAEKQSNAAREDGSQVHIVRSGECLWAIAAAYSLSFGELARLNGIEWSGAALPPIQPGQEIIVGAASE